MVGKGLWVVLPYLTAKELPGMRIISPGVNEERDQQPSWIGDNSYCSINSDSLPIAAMSNMQYGQVLDFFIRELSIADPTLGPVYMLKADVIDEFYRIVQRPGGAPNMGLVLTSDVYREDLVEIPLPLTMGCKNSLPIF